MCRAPEKSCTEYDRFGFNGKENDKEWGNQLIQDYGFRLYNPAIAKFLSVDPLAPEYPELTTYQFASNNPIKFIDLDGLEGCTPEAAKKAAEKAGYKRNQPPLNVATCATCAKVRTAKSTQKSFLQGAYHGGLVTVYNVVRFLERDMWYSSTWETIDRQYRFLTHIGWTGVVYIGCKDFNARVINGSSYSRGEYFGEVGTGALLGGPTGSVRGTVSRIVRKATKGVYNAYKPKGYLGLNGLLLGRTTKIRKALWGRENKYGGQYQTAIEHIAEGHYYNSRPNGRSSRFLEKNSNIKRVKELTNEAVQKGDHGGTANNYSVTHTFDEVIGTDANGYRTKTLKVYLDKGGHVLNSYPVPKTLK